MFISQIPNYTNGDRNKLLGVFIFNRDTMVTLASEDRNKRILLGYLKSLYTGLAGYGKWLLVQDLQDFLGTNIRNNNNNNNNDNDDNDDSTTNHGNNKKIKMKTHICQLLGTMSYDDLVTFWGTRSRILAARFPSIHRIIVL